MNIAIVIAVSDYGNPSWDLPGCLGDAQLMENLLNATNKYDDFLFLNQDTKSSNVKERLTTFIEDSKNKKINEIFFYYTGHGEFTDDEFYYLLSDFDESKKRQSSLNNSELDNLLKQLNPTLTVKVVDACQSGVTYIKSTDKDVVRKQLDQSKSQFNKCYFMFSSMLEQSSLQNDRFSYFTKSFVESVLKSDFNNMRYKYIIDYISDEFENHTFGYLKNQKPFFVTQADFTESFCLLEQSKKHYLLKELGLEDTTIELDDQDNQDNHIQGNQEQEKASLLEELVKKDAEDYCTEEEVLEILEKTETFIESYQYSVDLTSICNINLNLSGDYEATDSTPKSIASIGKWLTENTNSYFAKILYSIRPRYGSGQDSLDSLADGMDRAYLEQQMLEAGIYERFISGFELNVDVPYRLVDIIADPKYPNIDSYRCIILFVFSQVSIRFFYFYSVYKLKSFKIYYYEGGSDWQTVDVKMKEPNGIEGVISRILDSFDSFIIEPIKSRYPFN